MIFERILKKPGLIYSENYPSSCLQAKTIEISISKSSAAIKIRTKGLHNKSLDHYRYTNLLSSFGGLNERFKYQQSSIWREGDSSVILA
jgi:hypothetical protein